MSGVLDGVKKVIEVGNIYDLNLEKIVFFGVDVIVVSLE